MSTFYKNYVSLCAANKKSPSRAAEEAGFSRTAPNGWKKGKIPSDTTIERLAQYFGVSSDALTRAEHENIPTTQESSEDNDEATAALHEFIRTSTAEERQELIKFSEFIKSKRK